MYLDGPNTPIKHLSEITTIAKGAGIAFIGAFIGTGLKYIFELIVARNLGAALFGIFFLGFTVFKLLERLSTLGLHNGVLRFVSLYRGIGDTGRMKGTILFSLKTVLIVGAAVALFMVLSSSTISTNLFHQKDMSLALKIFAVGVIFTAVTEISVFSTQAFRIMKYKVLVRMILEPGSRILLVLGAILMGWRLHGATTAFTISLIVGSLFSLYYLNRVFPFLLKRTILPVYESRSILSFSWPLFFVGFLNLFLHQVNTLMLGYFKLSEDVGIYGAAQRTAFLLIIILSSFNDIFAPVISDLYNRKELAKLGQLFKIVTKWIFTFSFPVFMILVFFSREILNLWGKEYTAGMTCLIIICCAQLINCSAGSVGYMIMMTGRTKINLMNAITVLITTVSAGLLLIPRYGILGAAMTTAISIVLINIISLVEVYAILKMHPYKRDLYKPLLAGLMAVLAMSAVKKYWIPSFDSFFLLAFGSLFLLTIYAIVILLLKIEEEEKTVIRRIVAKIKGNNAFEHKNA